MPEVATAGSTDAGHALHDPGVVWKAAERYAARVAFVTSIVGAIVGGSLLPRAQWMQARRIRRTLRRSIAGDNALRPFKLPVTTSLADALKSRFDQTPYAPFVVTGPQGVGKANLVHETMLAHQKKGAMCMYLSLSQEPVRSPDGFVRLFVDRSGFWVKPTNSLLMRSLLRTKPEKARISEEDIELAFKAIEIALRQERDSGWPRGIPIFCIEELHVRGREMINIKSPLVGRFLEWCGHLALSQLAHIVFVASIRAAMRLESAAGLQYMRDLIFVDFPNDKRVRQALNNVDLQLTAEDQSKLIEALGGDMLLISQVIYAVKRGTPVVVAVEDRIAEAVQDVEWELTWHLTSIVKAAGDARLQHDRAKRFMRLWRLMQAFSDKTKVRQRELIANVFGVHRKELHGYVAHGFLSYTLQSFYKRIVGDTRLIVRTPRTSWPNKWVAAGSPCMHEAFKRVVSKLHHQEAYQWAAAVARGFELAEREQELGRLVDRQRNCVADVEKHLELTSKYAKEWTDLCGETGPEHVAEMWRQSYAQSVGMRERLKVIEEELLEVQQEHRKLRKFVEASAHDLPQQAELQRVAVAT